MLKRWKAELNRFLLLIAISGLCGWFLGIAAAGWSIAVVVSVYSLWLLLRLKDLVTWVEANNNSEAPESKGVWGDLFDTLNQHRKLNHDQQESLTEIINRARESTDAIAEAIVVTNQAGLIQWFNKASGHLLGLKPETDIQHPLTNMVRDPRFVRFFKRGNYQQPIEVPSPCNPDTILQISVTAYGQQRDHLVLARDITRIHNLEQTRKDFVANVSHELRTPLTVIKGYVETFLDTLDPQGQKLLYRGLTQMSQQTARMEMIVADLLLLSKLETEDAQQALSPVNVPSLLQQVYDDAIAINDAKQHQIQLEKSSDIGVIGIENELRSAFSNLVINAVKYTPEHGSISIRWWHDSEGAHLSVKDSGIGIEERHLPRLTERFYRADPSRHSKTGGTGLGLAIVKHVLVHHDAKLEIKSELNVGSEFLCHFPTRALIHQNNIANEQSIVA